MGVSHNHDQQNINDVFYLLNLLDRYLKALMGNNLHMGSKIVHFMGDF